MSPTKTATTTTTATATMALLLSRLSAIPGMEALNKELAVKLCEESSEEDAAAERARREAEAQRARYLKARVAWAAVEDLVTRCEVDRAKREEEEAEDAGILGRGAVLSDETKSLLRLSEAFTALQLRDHLRLLGAGAGRPVSLLGLDADRHLKARPLSDEDRSVVHRLVEEALFGRACSLLSLVENRDGEDDDDDRSLVFSAGERFARASRLPEMVAAEVDASKESADDAAATRGDHGALSRHLDVLSRSAAALDRLARRHWTGEQAEADVANANYLVVKCRTLVMKIKCLELEVLCATYRPDSVSALRRVRAHLDRKGAALRAETDAAEAGLARYESAGGEELRKVAEDYAATKAAIEGKKWALRELQEQQQQANHK